MKLLFTFCVSLVVHVSMGQATFLSVREVYDFAVGDSFQYRTGNSGGGNQYSYRIITSKQTYGNDSIIYGCKTIFLSNPPQINNSNLVICNLDSSALYGLLNGIPASTVVEDASCVNLGTNSTCEVQYNYTASWNCDGAHEIVTENCFVKCQQQLGIVRTTFSRLLCGLYSGSATNLIYAHKTNGYVYGTPYPFPVGVFELDGAGNGPGIFPNPVEDVLSLKNFKIGETITVHDLSGRMLFQKSITSLTDRLELTGLNRGFYFVQSENVALPFVKM